MEDLPKFQRASTEVETVLLFSHVLMDRERTYRDTRLLLDTLLKQVSETESLIEEEAMPLHEREAIRRLWSEADRIRESLGGAL